MFLGAQDPVFGTAPRERLAELIRSAIRTARAEGEVDAADELISILELMDADARAAPLSGSADPHRRVQ